MCESAAAAAAAAAAVAASATDRIVYAEGRSKETPGSDWGVRSIYENVNRLKTNTSIHAIDSNMEMEINFKTF